jgi:hypothetical protein
MEVAGASSPGVGAGPAAQASGVDYTAITARSGSHELPAQRGEGLPDRPLPV